MDITDILDSLNDRQRDAVAAEPGPLLVLAGAGSGKTRVLVHRMAWLMRTQGVSPTRMLAVTFTNKAAQEMRTRIEGLLGVPAAGLWIGTFHGLCHRLLRTHWQAADLPQLFQILDSDDQLRLVRRALKNLNIDETKLPPKTVQWFINQQKDAGIRPNAIAPGHDIRLARMRDVYAHYQDACERAGAVDFTELLLRAHEMLRAHPEIAAHYSERFLHVLVDEFQDTNAIQYQWLNTLSQRHRNLFVVGDDDQSIYGWRGACIENIQRFDKDFPGASVIRLEQNYRSTSIILDAANALISRNTNRLGKNLWTDGAKGELIQLYSAFNEVDEARFVIEKIRQWVNDGNLRSEVAILYRSNAQSRVFEETLVGAAIPYRVYGGQRFFERAEIKDALSYLRLITNRDDDTALERIINMPTRGIGDRTLETIRHIARTQTMSLWNSMRHALATNVFTARAANALHAFVKLIETLDADSRDHSLGERVQLSLDRSGLLKHFRDQQNIKEQSRADNLEELVNAAAQFEDMDMSEELLPPMAAFLSHAALESGNPENNEWDDCVQLMTLHSAKGLEFANVFICGLEERLFPHSMSMDSENELEEERRLCYVGVTRARKHLTLTYADTRRIHGSETPQRPSRFLAEFPKELIEDIGPRRQPAPSRAIMSSRVDAVPQAFSGDYYVGQRVAHAKFGEGTILNHEGRGPHARVQINFERQGTKWLVLSYANLSAV